MTCLWTTNLMFLYFLDFRKRKASSKQINGGGVKKVPLKFEITLYFKTLASQQNQQNMVYCCPQNILVRLARTAECVFSTLSRKTDSKGRDQI